MSKPYQVPEGYYDLPFSWIYEGADLANGSIQLNQALEILGGYGDFVLRRVVGLQTILNPTTGQFQIRDRDLRYIEDSPQFAGGTPDVPIAPELLYRETGAIRFDLYNILKGGSGAGAALAPVHIGAVTNIVMSGGDDEAFNTKAGPYSFGGALWSVGNDNNVFKLRVFKSTDNGATWAEQNAAGAPTYQQDTVPPSVFLTDTVAQDANNPNLLYVTFWNTDQTLRVKTFDMNTGLWSTTFPSAIVYLSATVGIAGLTSVFRPSDGVLVVALASGNTSSGGFDRPYYATLNTGTGVWSALLAMGPIADGDARTWTNFGSALGNSNLVHFFMTARAGGGIVTLLQQVLHTDGTLGSLQTVIAATAGLSETTAGGSHQVGGQTEVFFGVVISVGTTASYYSLRANSSDAPLWIQELMFTNTNPPFFLASAIALTDLGGVLTAFFHRRNLPILTGTVDLFMMQKGVGGWPATFTALGSFVNTSFPTTAFLAAQLGGSWGLLINVFSSGGLRTMGFIGGQSASFAQICFQGARRNKGVYPFKASYDRWNPKSYTYINQFTLTQAFASPDGLAGAITPVVLQITDYDFELHELRVTYSTPAGLPVSGVNAKLFIYDAHNSPISNVPGIDFFFNQAQSFKNGALSPILLYPKETHIRCDVQSLTFQVPLVITFHWVGKNRIPC